MEEPSCRCLSRTGKSFATRRVPTKFRMNLSAGRCHNKGCLLVSVLCLRWPSRLNRPNQKPEYANESTCRRPHKMLLLLSFFSAFYVVLHCHVARDDGWINTAYKQLNVGYSILHRNYDINVFFLKNPADGLHWCRTFTATRPTYVRAPMALMCTGKRGN